MHSLRVSVGCSSTLGYSIAYFIATVSTSDTNEDDEVKSLPGLGLFFYFKVFEEAVDFFVAFFGVTCTLLGLALAAPFFRSSFCFISSLKLTLIIC